MRTVMLKEIQHSLEQLIDSVLSDVEPTIIRTDKGKQVVVISLDEFNSWKETLYLLSNPANAAHLRQSIWEAKTGKTVERSLIEA